MSSKYFDYGWTGFFILALIIILVFIYKYITLPKKEYFQNPGLDNLLKKWSDNPDLIPQEVKKKGLVSQDHANGGKLTHIFYPENYIQSPTRS